MSAMTGCNEVNASQRNGAQRCQICSCGTAQHTARHGFKLYQRFTRRSWACQSEEENKCRKYVRWVGMAPSSNGLREKCPAPGDEDEAQARTRWAVKRLPAYTAALEGTSLRG
jgi:hypothetical protein